MSKFIKVTVEHKPLTITSGLLKDLDENQVSRRKDKLSKKGSAYEIIKPVQFKVGEVFEYMGEALPKTYYPLAKDAKKEKPKGGASSAKESKVDGGKTPAAFDPVKVLGGEDKAVLNDIDTGKYKKEEYEALLIAERAGEKREHFELAIMEAIEDIETGERSIENQEFLTSSVKDLTEKLQADGFTVERVESLIAMEAADQNRAGAISILNNKLESIKQSEKLGV